VVPVDAQPLFAPAGKKVQDEDVSELPEVDQNTKKQLRQRK